MRASRLAGREAARVTNTSRRLRFCAAGPIPSGIYLATSLLVRHVYAGPVVCPVVFALCIYLVGRMQTRILGRWAFSARLELKRWQKPAEYA